MQLLTVQIFHAKGAFAVIDKIKQKHKEGGFTIIEVMIVLAIAGLIMVVVFMAVPALQRSGRNNALDSSANSILTGVSEYVTNNAGLVPGQQTSAAPSSNEVTIGTGSSNQQKVKVDSGVTAFSVYNGTTGTGAVALLTSSGTVGAVQAVVGTAANCNDNGNGVSGTATARSYVVLYVAEGGSSGKILKCIGS